MSDDLASRADTPTSPDESLSPTPDAVPVKDVPGPPSSAAPGEAEPAKARARPGSASEPVIDTTRNGARAEPVPEEPDARASETAARSGAEIPSQGVKPSAVDQEIVLGNGRTLSDYLEEEPAPPAKETTGLYRSVPNVERLVVPPPGGVALSREKDAGSGTSSGGQGAPTGGLGTPSPADRTPAASDRKTQTSERTRPVDRRKTVPDERAGAGADRVTASSAQAERPTRPPAPASLTVPVDAGPDSEPEDEDFGAMLESSLEAASFDGGETVRGRIVAIGPDVAFLDIGGKSEATIDLGELRDDEGDIEAEVGDTIEALVVSTEGGLKLSRKLGRGAAAKEQLADAFRAGLPVEGRVEKSIKGGYEVRIAGQRAFCPISQIDSVRTTETSVHEGKVYTFRIIEYKEGGRNLVVSRRALLQAEDKKKAEEAKKSIVPGAVLQGRVVSVREYGAFVDLGGVQGLLHVSEMGWSRVTTPAEIVKPGDEITVKVLKVDEEKGKISLGMKQLQADPWSTIAGSYAAGQIRTGRVVRVQDFGAFIELEPGIEALAHSSTFAPTGKQDGWKQTVPPGTTGEFEVLTIDSERKRIGVAFLGDGSWRASREERAAEGATSEPSSDGAPESPVPAARASADARPAGTAAGRVKAPPPERAAIRVGARMMGKVERHESFGVFVYLAPGRTGLMPAGESATQRGADLKKTFPAGGEIEVMVLDVDPSGRRIRLSRKALLEMEEKTDAKEFATRHEAKETFGSIGDKLRAALASRQK